MKATKYELNVTLQALSKDVFAGLLHEIMANLDGENVSGSIIKDDGDSSSWVLTKTEVEF